MLRRMKEELTKQKNLNSSLLAEVEALRRGSADGTRPRANGRATPSDEAHDGVLRNQLVDAQRQTQRLTAENQDLHRRVELVQGDLERLRRDMDSLQREAEERLIRIEELQDDNDQLQASLQIARRGGDESMAEQLQRENITLKKENEQLSHKIELLLEVDPQSTYGGGDLPNRRVSITSSEEMETGMSGQLDDWRHVGSSSSRPIR